MNEAGNNIATLLKRYENSRKGLTYDLLNEEDIEELCAYFEDENNVPKALEVVEWGLERYPYATDLLIRKADILLYEERLDEAESILQKALVLDRTNELIQVLMYELYVMQEKVEEAEGFLEAHIHLFAKEVRILIYKDVVDILEKHNYFSLMLDYLFKIIAQNPEQENEMMARMAFQVHLTARYEEAIIFYKRIIDSNPFLAHLWLFLGIAYQGILLYEKAVEAYEYALALDENIEMALRNMLKILLVTKKYNEAIIYINRLKPLLSFPEADLYITFGKCYFYTKNYEQARQNFLQARDLAPQNLLIYKFIAKCFIREKNFFEAVSYLQDASKIDEKNKIINKMLAECYTALNQYPDALFYYLKAIVISPNNVALWKKYLSFLYTQKLYLEGQQQALVAYFKNHNPIFLFYVSAFSFFKGETDKAEVYMQMGMKENPKYFATYLRLFPQVKKEVFIQPFLNQLK